MSEKSIKAFESFKHSQAFEQYAAGVSKRLAKGAEDYGDESFSKDPVELIKELQDECLDLAGWGFILHTRLQKMRAALEAAEHDREAKKRMAAPKPERWGVFSRIPGVAGCDDWSRSMSDPTTYTSAWAAEKAVIALRIHYPHARSHWVAQRITAVHK